MSTFFRIIKSYKAKLILYASLFLLLPSLKSFSQNQVQRPVDVVVCMDLSGSTNGLIEVFRDKMWDIINQWKMYTPTPALRIGVIGFSRFSFSDGSGYVKVISGLTDDYDQLSSNLFEIKPYVENGIQFVGAALGASLHDMEWTERPNAMKLVYIMGNGEVTLGNYDYHKLCEEAKGKGIVVNTVYCEKTLTQLREKEMPGWQKIAELTGGDCYEVNVIKRVPLIQINSDMQLLASLNDSLNKTYIPYGKNGIDRLKRMLETDENAGKAYANYLCSRIKYKLSEHYASKQLSWDVVAYKQTYPDSKLAAIKPSTNANQRAGKDLEETVNTNLDKRLKIIESMKLTLPVGNEEKMHAEAGQDNFEMGNMLDRVLISSFYKQAMLAGFKN